MSHSIGTVAVRAGSGDSRRLEQNFRALFNEEKRANRRPPPARPIDAGLGVSNLFVWVYAAAHVCQSL